MMGWDGLMSSSDDHKRTIIAGAGTGKTTMLRKIATERSHSSSVLYLTYTNANACEFRASVANELGYVPANITIMTWFSFLLAHGVRPFPAQGFTHRIDRMLFNEGRVQNRRGISRGAERYYCPIPGFVYKSRLSDLAVLCDEQWNGEVTNRVCSIYDTILVDEGQDFAGYDYDVLGTLMEKAAEMVIVGDPRQQTYRTGNEPKHSGVPHIFEFLQTAKGYTPDTVALGTTFRCSKAVIDLANSLYPKLPQVTSSAERASNPLGLVSKIKKSDFETWTKSHNREFTVLRYDARTKVPTECHMMNMGDSKGLTLEDVVIFPTPEMKKWLDGKPVNLKDGTRAKLYVAITRARGDLFFVV